jgi:hypothetical protein
MYRVGDRVCDRVGDRVGVRYEVGVECYLLLFNYYIYNRITNKEL